MSTHEKSEEITRGDTSSLHINSSQACAGAGDLGRPDMDSDLPRARSDMNSDLPRHSMCHRPIELAPGVLLGQNVPDYSHHRPGQYSDSRYQNGDVISGRYCPSSQNRTDGDDCLENMQDILRNMRTTIAQQRQPPQNFNNQRPKVMPDTFDGRGSWAKYLAHFETVADINQWDCTNHSF